MEHYCIPEYDDSHEFLSHLARRMGKLKKGTDIIGTFFRGIGDELKKGTDIIGTFFRGMGDELKKGMDIIGTFFRGMGDELKKGTGIP